MINSVRRWPVASLLITGVLLGLTALLLAIFVRTETASGAELAIKDQVQAIELPGLFSFMEAVSLTTGTYTRLILVPAAVVLLWLTGHRRSAKITIVGSAIVGITAMMGDFGLGLIVGRVRPIEGSTELSFPSAHTYGTVLFFGLIALLVLRHCVPRRYGLPTLGVLGILTLLVGPSRIFLNMHWPADVVAGYIFGAASLAFLVAFYFQFEKAPDEPEKVSVIDLMEAGRRI